jgi:hypothetical protein
MKKRPRLNNGLQSQNNNNNNNNNNRYKITNDMQLEAYKFMAYTIGNNHRRILKVLERLHDLVLNELSIRTTLESGYLSRYNNGLLTGQPGFDSLQEQRFLFSMTSRLALGHAQTPIKWVLGNQYPEIRRPGREDSHSPQFSTEAKNGGAILLPHTSLWHNASMDNFTFTFTLFFANGREELQ